MNIADLRIEKRDGVVIACIVGEVDLSNADQLRKVSYYCEMYCQMHGERAGQAPADTSRCQFLCKIHCYKPLKQKSLHV